MLSFIGIFLSKIAGWPSIVWQLPIFLSFSLEFPFNCDTSSGLWRTVHPVISRHYPGMRGQVLPVQSMSADARSYPFTPPSLSLSLSPSLSLYLVISLSISRRSLSLPSLSISRVSDATRASSRSRAPCSGATIVSPTEMQTTQL